MRNSGQRIAPLPIFCSLPMLAGRQEIITRRHYLSHLFLPADLTACETRARKTAFATEPFSPDGLSRK